VPLGKCYGGFRYWRIPRRSPGVAYRKISPPMGAGGYFMEVSWALPVGLHWVDQKTHFQEGRGKKPGIASTYESLVSTVFKISRVRVESEHNVLDRRNREKPGLSYGYKRQSGVSRLLRSRSHKIPTLNFNHLLQENQEPWSDSIFRRRDALFHLQ